MLTSPSSRPLVLDLDGTLLRTDTFHEMMVQVLRKKPWVLFLLPFWLWKSRAYAKVRLAEYAPLDPTILPYNPALLAFAEKEAKSGRPLLLATGTNQKVAESIASHFGFFQEVIGSDTKTNMTGLKKQQALLTRFGPQGFDYAGDSPIDAYIWQVCAKALVVHPKRGVLKVATSLKDPSDLHYFPRERKRPRALLQSLRPLSWSFSLWFFPSWPLILLWSAFTSSLLITGDLLNLHQARVSKLHSSQFAEGHLHLITAFSLSFLLLSCPLLVFILRAPWEGFISLVYMPFFMTLDRLTRPLHPGIRWIILGLSQLLALSLFTS
ncbi:MAG: haloacid dehalogenase-like hydrolase [Alphaproteobacteria bacterium]|nr:haloacid dehalogenase-like hydrolase [Alphaproteobacteria bacterium]